MTLSAQEKQAIQLWMDERKYSARQAAPVLEVGQASLSRWLRGDGIRETQRRKILSFIGYDKPNCRAAKLDKGKPDASLLLDFAPALIEVAKVGGFGLAKGYQRSSWKAVPDAEQRYTAALLRHLLASQSEEVDPESGLDHMAHAAWNALAIVALRSGK